MKSEAEMSRFLMGFLPTSGVVKHSKEINFEEFCDHALSSLIPRFRRIAPMNFKTYF